jgi:2-amino-4-hydroxy-6-hydroxymethyldihydropteridine diphosphokinase
MNDIAYLALGSNLDDRLEFLRQSIIGLENHPQINILRKSRIYETESIEDGGEGDFLNAVICIGTSLSPLELLNVTQNIEGSLGRPLPPRHGPRCIDIDILFFEHQNSTEHQLQMPHPRMYRRAFVLAPLLDVLQNGEINLTPLTW